ncbi:hypothetical protein XENOCAPTIV_000259 [Xenoophorus captivus]|uniref:Uncharacterized protein n=1 Tax=Xenoophorus captivus TaxID=1517983 RepID=A0ABV0S5A1_9TELE
MGAEGRNFSECGKGEDSSASPDFSAVHVQALLLCLPQINKSNGDLSQSISDHLEWLNHLSDRVETLHMNTAVFVQMNPKPRAWTSRRGSRQSFRLGRLQQADDALSEFGWSPFRMRRNSDAASEMSCNW